MRKSCRLKAEALPPFKKSFECETSLLLFNGTPEIYGGEGGDGNNGTRGREEEVDPEKDR